MAGALAGDHEAGSHKAWLTVYLAVLLSLILTHLDIYLGLAGVPGFDGLLVLPVAAAPFLAFLLLVHPGTHTLEACLDAWRRNGLAIAAMLVWIVAHAALLNDRSLLGDDVDYTQLFPAYHLAIVLLGITIAATPAARDSVAPAGTVALLVLAGSIVYDALYPGTFSALASRPAGFSLDANTAAFNLLIILSLVIDWQRGGKARLLLIVVTFMASALTLSRGALLLWVVFAGAMAVSVLREAKLTRVLGLLLGAVAAVTIVVSIGSIISETPLSGNAQTNERLAQFSGQSSFLADDYRPRLFSYYLDLAYERPLLGHGTGYSLGIGRLTAPYGYGPHNIYLREWVDNGLAGMAAYLLMLGAIGVVFLRRGEMGGMAVVGMLAVQGVFSHTVIDSKATLLVLGLLLGRPAGSRM